MDILRVSDVFVPGRLPAHTYNPRSELRLEQRLNDYVEEVGSILTVAGPTKTGKSVLLRAVVQHPVWVDGQGIDSVDTLWRRIGDALSIYTTYETEASGEQTGTGKLEAEASLLSVLKVSGGAEDTVTAARGSRYGVERPVSAVARAALERLKRPLVVDDFHFIQRSVQRDIVRALKPLLLADVPVIFVSIGHRVQDVVTAEPDMTGRVSSLKVDFWSSAELQVIASKGFAALNVLDPGGLLAEKLASTSYGSPHLMQKFCRELCKANGVRETCATPFTLGEPEDWSAFFAAQVDGASADWFQRLLRGPQERGSVRTQWPLKDGRTLDGYGLTLAAIASTGPELSISKDRIKVAVETLVDGSAPAVHQTTRVLQHMTKIAAKRATEPVPTEEELYGQPYEPDSVPDVQPVLEYLEDGPSSTLHIADPFFAFYVKWGADQHLSPVEVGDAGHGDY